jgi:hypothetical protein
MLDPLLHDVDAPVAERGVRQERGGSAGRAGKGVAHASETGCELAGEAHAPAVLGRRFVLLLHFEQNR